MKQVRILRVDSSASSSVRKLTRVRESRPRILRSNCKRRETYRNRRRPLLPRPRLPLPTLRHAHYPHRILRRDHHRFQRPIRALHRSRTSCHYRSYPRPHPHLNHHSQGHHRHPLLAFVRLSSLRRWPLELLVARRLVSVELNELYSVLLLQIPTCALIQSYRQ